MAWIESHTSLLSHPKTKRLCRLLGISLPAAIGYLHMLWWWAMEYTPDGLLSRYEPADIADAVSWDDAPERFLTALVESGFLDHTDDGYVLHDWYDYAGRLVEQRQRNAERMRRARAKHVAEQTTPSDSTYNERAEHVRRTFTERVGLPNTHTHNLTKHNQTIPNHTHTTVQSANTEQAATAEAVPHTGVCVSEDKSDLPPDDIASVVRYYCERTGDRQNVGSLAMRMLPLVQQYGGDQVRRQIDVIATMPELRNPFGALKTALREGWEPSKAQPPTRASPAPWDLQSQPKDPRYTAFYDLFTGHKGTNGTEDQHLGGPPDGGTEDMEFEGG
ncbi:MAG: hypothetical protein K6T83_07900 [Alicyclobacillus sp.]|nr:hypothetical protein [Alicyclobacillus sp.]